MWIKGLTKASNEAVLCFSLLSADTENVATFISHSITGCHGLDRWQ